MTVNVKFIKKLIYSKETTPLGTGGGLRLAMSNIVGDQVFVFNEGRIIESGTYKDLTREHSSFLSRMSSI